ncbi:MAG: energy transducer TonB, partial [Gammaproteobacteria bacterium]|nr:energy transducer TonB [Gammaproteobacteria bacterium]
AVLASRFDDALGGGRFEEAALTLANFKAATPGDPRLATFEQRLYSAEISHALADAAPDRAAAYLRQAQQSGSVSAEQLARWRSDIAHRQSEATVQRLSGLIDDRIRDGRLTEGDDSARVYLLQLAAAAPGHASTQRATRDLIGACLRKARDAALARSSADEEHWLNEARSLGLKPADLAAFQKDLAGARQKAAQADGERQLQLVRERVHDGRLTDPAQDSAAFYLTQLQTSAPGLAGAADAGHELAVKLLERARTSILAGKSGDADIAQAKHWGASPQDLAALQQLVAGAAAKAIAADTAALAPQLKLLRGVPPEYPPVALADHVSGSVTLTFTVDTKGDTRDIEVVEASPPHVFDRAAINAVKHWHYAPMLVNGAAVEVPVKTRVRFELPK